MSSKRKLVLVDESAVALAAKAHANASGYVSPPADGHDAMRAALAALPDALLVSEGGRAQLSSNLGEFTALDRETLVEAIRDALTEAVMVNTENEPYNAKAEADALISRAEGTP